MGIDAYLRERLEAASAGGALVDRTMEDSDEITDGDLLSLLESQLLARRVDLYARVLQERGQGFYTIGSLGHESNAAVALAVRPSDPAMLHYRSAGFYCARASQVPGHDPVRDILLSLMSSADDPISGGRHKVFGNKDLAVIPQTSTIASHLPRAVGLAFAHERAHRDGFGDEWPFDALVVASIGDASLNHSTAAGALGAAEHATYQGVPIPLLLVVEDNGLGISVRSPTGWVGHRLSAFPLFGRFSADGHDPAEVIVAARAATAYVRERRRPAVLHLRTVRFMGHAGSDAEIAYRSQREIEADYALDPLLATAALVLQRGLRSAADLARLYAAAGSRVDETATALLPVRRLSTAAEVMAPLTRQGSAEQLRRVVLCDPSTAADEQAAQRQHAFRGRLPEQAGGLTLAQSITTTLTDLMLTNPRTLVFGQDVGVKGGVYGVTRGLRRAFGAARVFDTLLDEQAILGTALGSALAGFLPIPEIQYLAYVHNAIDQLRGEAATLAFFSAGQYGNGMVVRLPGLAYQRGFGGHFHNDNSVAALMDIPGLVVAVPSGAREAPGLLRALAAMAMVEQRPTVLIEPIALYHSKDLLTPGDSLALAPYLPARDSALPPRDEGCIHVLADTAADTLVVTFGNGVGMSRRAILVSDVRADLYDLRWLAPLPADHLAMVARGYASVLVVDETRRSGGVSERVITALVDAGYSGRLRRVASGDSAIPLGPAASSVLLDEVTIVEALRGLTA